MRVEAGPSIIFTRQTKLRRDVRGATFRPMDEPSPVSRCTAEFLGTFLLVFTIGCNVSSGNSMWGAVSIACALMVSIYALGGISGGNFNPAVSFSLGLVGSMGGNGLPWGTVAMYSVVQMSAGLLSAFSYRALFPDCFDLAPATGYNGIQAGVCEALYTFMLCFVVLNVAAAKRYKDDPNQFYGLAIGFVIIAGAYGAGAVSGGCFNPAVAVAIDTSCFKLGFGWSIAYVAYQMVGATLAAMLFKCVRPEDFTDSAVKVLPSQLLSEFIGTFMLVLTVGLNVLSRSPATALSVASALVSMIYAIGDVSGAHLNPAVTIAVLLSGKKERVTTQTAAAYVLVQLAGGVAAAFTYSAIHGHESFTIGPQKKFGWIEVACAETLFTFVLAFVVLCVVVSEETQSQTMFGLAIGSCVIVGGFAVGRISGGSFNPAVSFGIAASHAQGVGFLFNALLYSIFEFAGGACAAFVFSITHTFEAASKLDKV